MNNIQDVLMRVFPKDNKSTTYNTQTSRGSLTKYTRFHVAVDSR